MRHTNTADSLITNQFLPISYSAGVSGLTTAYLLSKDPSNSITVVAKFMPGDYDIGYCSPWAGANFSP